MAKKVPKDIYEHMKKPPRVVNTIEKTIVERQVVKVKCRYCGCLNDDVRTICESCGARL